MKKIIIIAIMMSVVAVTSYASVENLPGGGKHTSAKKAKKKKSGYFHSFQH